MKQAAKKQPARNESVQAKAGESVDVLWQRYHAAEEGMPRHYARTKLINYFYKHRDDPQCFVECVRISIEDLGFYGLRDWIVRDRMTKYYNKNVEAAEDKEAFREAYLADMKKGYNARLACLDKLITLYINCGDYKNALFYCDVAIQHYESHATDAEEYIKKRERILRKMKR